MERMPTIRRLERLKVDRSISIQGLVDEDAQDFSVCLQSTSRSMPHTDVLFMLKPCFGVNGCTIICNTFLYESFGTPTVFSPQDLFTKEFPFSQGKSFTMVIVIKSNHYEVKVDERSILVFDHRVHPDKVSHIRLEGDMRVEFIECPRTLVGEISSYLVLGYNIHMFQKLPYIKELPHGLRDGQVLVIDTFIQPQSKSFQLHLTAKHQDIYAGFYTRVSFEGVITKVRCQGFVNDKRDEEVTIDGHLPIFRNRELELRVVIGQRRIELLLDGEWFADYDHQLPIEKLNSLAMDGDIALFEASVYKPKGHYLSLGHHKSRCCECSVM
ncbi:hypothetical protein CAPTEDRAFT_223868 [Capitella teleta]|uniref:Galectin n=1 Tax=Capitella teleta TaxID=283909 RepID=R7TI92_CAPTE|nr:hypothetical protein CAPTEDRAFT_223868 [Capitella teleta]|eukprot:ELT93553.1 hypothetical protein CAPTEDRAFT_223868 [Capitella teleta]